MGAMVIFCHFENREFGASRPIYSLHQKFSVCHEKNVKQDFSLDSKFFKNITELGLNSKNWPATPFCTTFFLEN